MTSLLFGSCRKVYLCPAKNKHMTAKNTYLESKPRFEILDGLRGVAALLVVGFHLFETYSHGNSDLQIINHGYLAVDFFFVLSGFVIGYAYDDRWNKMSIGGFFKRRLVRLHPMVIMGGLFGLLLFFLQDSGMFPAIAQTPWWKAILVAVIGMTLFPVAGGGWFDVRGWGEMHPINGPSWTLFFEYIANILYALVIRKLPRWALTVCVALFAVLTLDLTLNIDLFGLLAGRGGNANTVIGGWNVYDPQQAYIGITRLLFPFFCGLLLSRFHAHIKVKGGFWWCSLMVAVILAMPYIPGGIKGTPGSLNGWYNALVILVLFPLIVAMGAGSTITGKIGPKVCKFFGDISFPLYITHYPLMYCQMAWAMNHPLYDRDGVMIGSLSEHVMVSVGLLILAVGFSYACLKLYDEPVRKWLTEHWLKRA